MDLKTWSKLSIYDQMGTIGTEIGRTMSWRQNPHFGKPEEAFYRGLEYLDLSISDPKNRGAKLKELCRVREVLVDWYLGTKLYSTTESSLNSYFEPFAIASNLQRAKKSH